jgi:hypothetical protein
MADAQVFANAIPYALGVVAFCQVAITVFVLGKRAAQEVA